MRYFNVIKTFMTEITLKFLGSFNLFIALNFVFTPETEKEIKIRFTTMQQNMTATNIF